MNTSTMLHLPRTSMWNLAEMDRDYAHAKIPRFEKDSEPIEILDVGAHVGIFALWVLAEFPADRTHVTCYEAHPQIAALCRDNLTSMSAEVVECAVVGSTDDAVQLDAEGQVTLFEGRRTLLGTSMHRLAWQNTEHTVKARTLSAKKLKRCRILKLDVEGAELPILRDFQYGAELSALLIETHRREDFIELCKIAWGWGLEMTLANPGRNGCVTSAWVRP